MYVLLFFFSSRRRHTRLQGDWSSDVCSSDLPNSALFAQGMAAISVRVQNKPRTSHLVQAILNAIRYPFNSGSARQLYMRRSLLFDALKNYKTRLIWLDEAQHLLYQRRSEMSKIGRAHV